MKLNSIILGISPVGNGFPVVTERPNGDIVIENGKISAVSNDLGLFTKLKEPTKNGNDFIPSYTVQEFVEGVKSKLTELNYARNKPTELGGFLVPMHAHPHKFNPDIFRLICHEVKPKTPIEAAAIGLSFYVNPNIGLSHRGVDMNVMLTGGGRYLSQIEALMLECEEGGDSLLWIDLPKDLQRYISDLQPRDFATAVDKISRSLSTVVPTRRNVHTLHKTWIGQEQYMALVRIIDGPDNKRLDVFVYPPQQLRPYALDKVVEKQIPSIEDAPDSDDDIDVGLSDVFMLAVDAFVEGVNASAGNLVYVGEDLMDEDALDKVKTIATLHRDDRIHCLRISATTLKEILDSDNPFIRPEVLSYRVESNPTLDPINLRGVHDINIFGHYAKTIDMWFVGMQMNGDTYDFLLDN